MQKVLYNDIEDFLGEEIIMEKQLSLLVSQRNVLKKKVKGLRKQGIIPLHVYGPDIPSFSLEAKKSEVFPVLAKAGSNIPISLNLEGRKILSFVREVQWDAISEDLLHVDFLQVDPQKELLVDVPLVLSGEAPAAKETGGNVVQYAQTIQIRALPLSIPEELTLSVDSLITLDDVLRASDISLPEKVSLETSSDLPVARVQLPKVEKEPEAEEAPEEEGAEEGAEEEGAAAKETDVGQGTEASS